VFLVMLMFMMLIVGLNEPVEEPKKKALQYPRQVVTQTEAETLGIDLLE